MEGAGEWLFPRVHSDVVHQLVFGFERLLLPRTVLPVTHVFSVLRSSDVLHRHMADKFIHCPVGSGAGELPKPPKPPLAVAPLTHQLMFDPLLRAPDGSVAASTLDRHVQRFVQAQKLGDELRVVPPRADGLGIGVVVVVAPGEQLSG